MCGIYLWVEGDRLLGQVSAVPAKQDAIAAVRSAGFLPVPQFLQQDRARLVGGPERPAWEIEAWELPSYRRVLLQYDWLARTMRRVAP